MPCPCPPPDTNDCEIAQLVQGEQRLLWAGEAGVEPGLKAPKVAPEPGAAPRATELGGMVPPARLWADSVAPTCSVQHAQEPPFLHGGPATG